MNKNFKFFWSSKTGIWIHYLAWNSILILVPLIRIRNIALRVGTSVYSVFLLVNIASSCLREPVNSEVWVYCDHLGGPLLHSAHLSRQWLELVPCVLWMPLPAIMWFPLSLPFLLLVLFWNDFCLTSCLLKLVNKSLNYLQCSLCKDKKVLVNDF